MLAVFGSKCIYSLNDSLITLQDQSTLLIPQDLQSQVEVKENFDLVTGFGDNKIAATVGKQVTLYELKNNSLIEEHSTEVDSAIVEL